MITMTKASDIVSEGKTVYHLLRTPQQPDTLAYEDEKLLEMRLFPQKRLQRIFPLQYL